MKMLLAPINRPCYEESSLECYEATHRECSNDICRAVQSYGVYVCITILICLVIALIKLDNKIDN